jgi:hypothetical protein
MTLGVGCASSCGCARRADIAKPRIVSAPPPIRCALAERLSLLTGNAIAGGVGLLAGAVLLVPWLVGFLILSIFIWLTNPRR